MASTPFCFERGKETKSGKDEDEKDEDETKEAKSIDP